MEFIKTVHEVDERKVNLNQGGNVDYFTEQEQKDFYGGKVRMINGCYSYETTVFYHSHSTHLKADKTYIEKKLGLREVLRIMKKLSKGDRGALSKQLYPYYEKVGVSRLKPDLQKLYKEIHYVDINDLNNRQSHFSHVYIHIGSKYYFGSGDGLEALEDIAKKHLKHCIAILIEKGYITTSNTKKNRYMKGYQYTYSNTYYKLTEKAENLLKD